jgi:hypothetical protein
MERLTTEMVREHQRQSEACAKVISCLRRFALRDVWCRTFGGVVLVLCQNRNAIRRRYSEALSRHWEKLREKERKAAERLEKRSRMWTVVCAAARRLICSSAHARALLSVFELERHKKSCYVMLGFSVLACVKRRAHRRSLVRYSRLIWLASAALHRRAYVRAIKLLISGVAADDAPAHAPTPPWLEVSRWQRQQTIERLKLSEKWAEFFAKIAAQQPLPAAFTKGGADTESGIENSSSHGQPIGSFHAAKQESVRPLPAAAVPTPIKGAAPLSSKSSQDIGSVPPAGLKPLAPNVRCFCFYSLNHLPYHQSNSCFQALSASSRPVPKTAAPTALLSSSLPARGSQQQNQQQQLPSPPPQAVLQQQRPPLPPPSTQALASAPFAPSPPVFLSSEPLSAAFPTDDGGYEPDDAASASKKQRKKSKERQAAGAAHDVPKSSESAPASGDVSKPPRFRKSDAPPPQAEPQAGGSRPPMQRAGSNTSVGSAASQDLATQATLLAFKAAR